MTLKIIYFETFRLKTTFRESLTEVLTVIKHSEQYNYLKILIMRNLTKLNGVKVLSKKEQKSISGGCAYAGCDTCLNSTDGASCPTSTGTGCCFNGICISIASKLCHK